MVELIDKFKIKNAIYEMRNKKLSDADMEIWHLINELPADMNRKGNSTDGTIVGCCTG